MNARVPKLPGASPKISLLDQRATASTPEEKGLKLGHLLVLRALKVANIAHGSVVTISEITQALLTEESKQLKKLYKKDFVSAISSILTMLSTRGLVFSPGKIGKNRYYGSTTVLDPKKAALPTFKPRRRRVLELVRAAVGHYERAVRMSDILGYAAESASVKDIEEAFITRDVLNLTETGELRLVGSIRRDEGGGNLYLPADLNPELYKPTEPLTWLELVEQAFERLWTERKDSAINEGRKPRPVSTGEVRAKLSTGSNLHKNLNNPKLLPNALIQLAQTEGAQIRRVIRSGCRALLWAPVEIPDEELDIGDAYASDSERVAEALERAVGRLNRPVCVRDVKDEVEMDPTLEPAGSQSLREILSDIAKKEIDGGDGRRRERVSRRCFYVGKLNGNAYYCHQAEMIAEASSYVHYRCIESRWTSSPALTQPTAFEQCSLPTVAVGHAMLLKTEARSIFEELNSLLATKSLDGATRREAEILTGRTREVATIAEEWLNSVNKAEMGLPDEVSITVPGWTTVELLPILKPIYPAAQKISSANQLTTLLSEKIRRVPNPNFESRFSKNPARAGEFLYDRADALLFAATHWGSRECALQAMIAKDELGLLRDPRFVLPAIESHSFEIRLKGVACLAFLWSDEGNKRLRQAAIADAEPAVRQSALWAYGFAGGEAAMELFRDRGQIDTDPTVRSFVATALVRDNVSWWAM